ncbi:MAG: hypothetical protein P5702_00240 [Limnospira sp. PMC 1291.21]|uniref:Uncharacterized protein n=1 Tax=Limnospira fusiformis PMC 851.14 TaxID=2219512 RepID=A0ABU9EJW8_LIMFS|nr:MULTISPECIES: hypothetical protein [Limnospira]EKD07443.1 hypothetical protein SPLC1_S411100 [Arthrospira platensis C1]MDC0839514.1 hypothetical protein [Limnoraphis robusta]MDY7052225.1 hypothetical protein [Limnospira fusiformis LS22]QJB25772.1 hypothetical protein HFV01_08170 [Limnospira fusiformis SAG 85.79]MDT9176050.1 hypothetical protein [Limnospira sp. PMC 1238.20]
MSWVELVEYIDRLTSRCKQPKPPPKSAIALPIEIKPLTVPPRFRVLSTYQRQPLNLRKFRKI